MNLNYYHVVDCICLRIVFFWCLFSLVYWFIHVTCFLIYFIVNSRVKSPFSETTCIHCCPIFRTVCSWNPIDSIKCSYEALKKVDLRSESFISRFKIFRLHVLQKQPFTRQNCLSFDQGLLTKCRCAVPTSDESCGPIPLKIRRWHCTTAFSSFQSHAKI